MVKNSIVCVIPARGGSKGIPGKNIRLIAGKPLIAWTIEAALRAEVGSRKSEVGSQTSDLRSPISDTIPVYVTTDDSEIAEVSRQYGADVIMRPAEISGDDASSESALLHALEVLEQEQGLVPDIMVFLQCTSPLTTAEDIEGTIHALIESEAETALAVAPFHYFLWKEKENKERRTLRQAQGLAAKNQEPGTQNQERLTTEGTGINHNPGEPRLLRQHREPEYIETGSVYAMRVPGFLEHKRRFFGQTVMHIIPADHRLEIDEMEDLGVAEFLLSQRSEVGGQKSEVGEQTFESYLEHPSTLNLHPSPQQRTKNQVEDPATSGEPRTSSFFVPFVSFCKNLQAVIFDFDGVLTDNKVYVDQNGIESVRCDRSDGHGISELKKAGIPVLILSRELNPVVKARCEKLGVECIHGEQDKAKRLQEVAKDKGWDLNNLIFVGNDIPDIEVMKLVGYGISVADAHPEVIQNADAVLTKAGGQGAVRELCDLVLQKGTKETKGSEFGGVNAS